MPPRKPLPRKAIQCGAWLEPEQVAEILRNAATYTEAGMMLNKTPAAVSCLAHELRLDGYDVPVRKGGRPRKNAK